MRGLLGPTSRLPGKPVSAITSRRILVVSYFHPPSPGAGGTRWASMARHLRAMGHSVTVVAADAWGGLPDDSELGVVRVRDLRSTGVLRRLLRRGKLTVAGDAFAPEPPPTALLTKVFVPDVHVVTWLPFAAAAVRRLIGRGEVDCLITTSPLETAHLLGLLLGARRPAWIADFRDGWTFEPLREPFPTGPQRALDRWLERRVVRTAEVVAGATRPIADDLERRLGGNAAWVSNGWDPALAGATYTPAAASRASHPVTLVYTGTLSGLKGRDPEPYLRAFLRALSAVRAEPGGVPMRLVHAGTLTTHEWDMIVRAGVADVVEHLGVLARADALALQRSADALILITTPDSSVATSKLFEYIVAGRPIVALAEGNEAERIVRETNTGITVPPDDVEAIAAALRRVASGELAAAAMRRATSSGSRTQAPPRRWRS